MVGYNSETDSILKKVLIESSCSFGKYLSKVDYLNINSGKRTEFFISPSPIRSL